MGDGGAVLDVLIGRSIHARLKIVDAFLANRMVHGKGVHLVGALGGFLCEAHHGVIDAQRRLVRRPQKLQGDLVGGGFLHAGELVELRLRHRLTQTHHRHARLAGARDHRRDAHHHGEQHGDRRFFHSDFAADQVTGLDVPGLMRHHPDQLIGRFEVKQNAGENEDIFAAFPERGKGIDLIIAHQPHFGRVGIEPGRFGQRRLIAVEHLLGFGIAQDIDVLRQGGQPAADQGKAKPGGESRRTQQRAIASGPLGRIRVAKGQGFSLFFVPHPRHLQG